MNKIIKIVSCFLLVGLLTACGFFSPKEKDFSGSGMSITLNDNFVASENVIAQLYIVSNDHIFFGNGESKATLSSQGYHNFTLLQYADLVLSVGQKSAELKSHSDDDTNFVYAYYESTVEETDYSYMLVCMEGDEKFYTMNFGCYTKNFTDETKDLYLNWAKTIKVE